VLELPLQVDSSGRPRSRSVVARAQQRQLVSTILLVSLPVVALMAAALPVMLAVVVVAMAASLVVVLFVWDVAALVGALFAWRRMLRGRPPVRPGVDYGVGPDVWLLTVPADDPYRAQDRRELVARGSPEAAARVLGGNLLRRTCGIAVPGLSLVALSYCCMTTCHRSDASLTRTALNSIRSATILYMNGHEGRCPSVDDLKADGVLERSFSSKDPWGNRWEIRCTRDDVTVSTPGPDRKTGTEDDLGVPPPQ
jgi:hypothetical protein